MITTLDKKNAFWNSFNFIFLSLSGFINFTLTLKSYQPEIFGLYILMISVFGLGYTFDFGFGAATIKQLSIAKKDNDTDLISRFFFTFLITYILIAVVITALISAYYFIFLSDSNVINKVHSVNTAVIFIYISISYFFRYLNNYLKNIFEGFAEFVILSKILIAVSVFNTLLILVLFFLNLDIVYLALFTLLVQIFATVLLFLKLIFSYKELKLSIHNFDFSLIKKYMMYGINIQAASFIGGLLDPVIKYLISSFLSLSFVTFYETSKKIIDLSNGLIFSAQKGLFNKLSENLSAGKLNDFVNNNLYYYSKMSNYYSILVYGLLNPLVCMFVLFWFKNYESVIILLLFFIPYSLINYGGALYTVIMVDGNGIRLVLIQSLNLFTTGLILFLSLYFSGSYLGLSAYYLSIIINTYILFVFLKRSNSFQYKNYLKSTLFRDLFLLNMILMLQSIFMYVYSLYYIWILLVFLFIYFIAFYKYSKYFYNLAVLKIFKEKLKFDF